MAMGRPFSQTLKENGALGTKLALAIYLFDIASPDLCDRSPS